MIEQANIPRWAAAVFRALRFEDPSGEPLRALGDAEWEKLLAFCDRAQLTLLLGRLDRAGFPAWVNRRLERNLEDNAKHTARIKSAFFEIADCLAAAGLDYVALKGFTQSGIPDLRFRVQYDIDLYCPPEQALRARDALLALGYAPAEGFDKLPIDHLPNMVRPNGWQWNGNYFDPEMPVAVDLHFRWWDPDTERIPGPGTEQFWPRRAEGEFDGRRVPVLDPADALGYAALHALRHWLRGSLKLYHVYELAWILHTRTDDGVFWETWRELHPPGLRRLEALSFRLAVEWFGCRVSPAVQQEIDCLPESVGRWFANHAASPIEGYFRPAKDEIWLHLALLDSVADRRSVLVRRLLPTRAAPVAAPQLAQRAVHHLRALPRVLHQAVARRWREQGLHKPFWTFLGAASVFNLALFLFYLLYNLYLLDLGFKEDFLGVVAGAMTAGSIAGTLPAGAVVQRLGLRRALLLCFGGFAAVSAARALASGPASLIAFAFLGGLAQSIWPVSVAPAVAQLTAERSRPRGFSVFFATGIGMGIVGGLLGGRLPEMMAALGAGAPVRAKQAALLAGCGFAALACGLVARSRFEAAPPRPRTIYPRSGFMLRFLAAIGVWTLAVGAFNPFFNVYFANYLHAPIERIGAVFSGAQLAQVAAVLLAPAVLRKLGLLRGIMAMQLATGLALAALAAGPAGLAAALVYAAYTSFQYMSEPGLYTLLMNQVRPEEQSGASALNFLAVFAAQAAAAALAGAAFTRFGYGPVLAVVAGLAALSAALFRILLRDAAASSITAAISRR